LTKPLASFQVLIFKIFKVMYRENA
jgi:hypothetical protein